MGRSAGEEDRALRSRALPSTPDPAPPPVEATLSRVEYNLRLAGDAVVTGQARLTFDVLKEGWVSVQTPPGVLVRDARLDGRPTRLVTAPTAVPVRGPAFAGRKPAAPPHLAYRPCDAHAGRCRSADILRWNGVHDVTGARVGIVGGDARHPRIGVDLSVTGGFVAEQVEAAGESRWVVYGNPDRPWCSPGNAR